MNKITYIILLVVSISLVMVCDYSVYSFYKHAWLKDLLHGSNFTCLGTQLYSSDLSRCYHNGLVQLVLVIMGIVGLSYALSERVINTSCELIDNHKLLSIACLQILLWINVFPIVVFVSCLVCQLFISEDFIFFEMRIFFCWLSLFLGFAYSICITTWLIPHSKLLRIVNIASVCIYVLSIVLLIWNIYTPAHFNYFMLVRCVRLFLVVIIVNSIYQYKYLQNRRYWSRTQK